MKNIVIIFIGLICALSFVKCLKKEQMASSAGAGALVFTANGEDFIRKGFVDKQGWSIAFDNLFVNIVDPTAYGEPGEAALKGSFWIDLARGDENADPVSVGKIEKVKAGNYQSLRFRIRKATAGEYKGYSIVMIGSAEKGGTKVPFAIKLDEEMDYDGKEGYVGDEIKGMLSAGGTAEVEITFHFDHIFGDKKAEAESHVNIDSVGFDFFNIYVNNGKVDVSQDELKSAEDFSVLCEGMWTLGHLGEGHCECTNQSSAKEQR